MTQPTCIVCGKKIAKRTESIDFWMDREDAPRTRAEAQQRTNHQITAVRYWEDGKVRSIYTWDGVSYVDKFFCNGACARKQAYASARHGQRYTWSK